MAIYYVRKTGNDASAGTSAGAAWLTVDKAANTVAAGDTVYIGAGVYRELVTMDTSGTSGSEISYIGDVYGTHTGDAGLVVISAFDSNSTAAVRTNCLDMNAKQFIHWTDVTFNGSNGVAESAVVGDATANHAYEGVVFTRCAMLGGVQGNAVAFFFGGATTPSTNGLTFNECNLYGRTYLDYSENASAQQDLKLAFNNCIIRGCTRASGTSHTGITYFASATSTHGVGGLTVANCTFDGLAYGVYATNAKSTTHVVGVRNCLFIGVANAAITGNAAAGTAVVYSNCRIHGASLTVQNASDGGGNDTTADMLLLGGFVDTPLYHAAGWSPYKSYEPVRIGSTSYNDCINNGSATYAPATDMYSNPRPLGTADDIGAVEANPRGQRSATWAADSSTYSMAFTSIGYHEFMLPVDAASTTVNVKAYKDASYAGTAPKLEILIGDASQGTDSMTVGTETEETLSVTFTPSAAGWARVRLYSYATAGTVFFDSLTVA